MLATLAQTLEELKEVFVPVVARAEDEEEGEQEGEEEEDEDEDEDEEEEGPKDPLDLLKAECSKDHHIAPYVHHYAECVDRVTKAQEDPDYAASEHKEDCVEEFFHLEHHINDCVTPRLFSKLK